LFSAATYEAIISCCARVSAPSEKCTRDASMIAERRSGRWPIVIRMCGTFSRRTAELHRGVDVVPARVHHADLLPHVRRLHFRREGQIGCFGHRQCVHVGADRDHRTGQRSLEQPDHARVRDAGPHLEAELPEIVGHERRRLFFPVRQLRKLVQLVTDRGDSGRCLRHLLVYPRERVLCGLRPRPRGVSNRNDAKAGNRKSGVSGHGRIRVAREGRPCKREHTGGVD
jgi:hypothetical protein